jgi:glycosyltransferase involved in cell wall biosynthesis
MKIALDATPLTIATGGIRRYTEELGRALAENFPQDEFWLLSSEKFEPPPGSPANLKMGRGPGNVLDRRWWLWGVEREIARLEIDVFHGTDFAVPYRQLCPGVMTIHDLSPWMDQPWHAASRRVRRRAPLLLRRGLATMVITPSETVRRQAIGHFRLAPERVAAIPLAAGALFRPVDPSSNNRPYLLYVGTIEPRKNLGFLLEVWRGIQREHPVELVLAGRRRADCSEITPEPGLHLTGIVGDEELPKLYSGALACLYPSCYEGFGLPVLEAMQCGAVVIASRDPAIAEVAGEAAILLEASDRRAWVETLASLLAEPERFKPFREKALARAAQFSWNKTAKLTREVYAQAAERFRKT